MSLFRRLISILGAGGAGAKANPGPEDFAFQATYGLRYAGWEPHHWGTYCKESDIITSLIEEGLWNAVAGTYGGRT